MYLKVKINQVNETLHYDPSLDDYNGFFCNEDEFDDDNEEFIEYLEETYEEDLRNAYNAGYNDLSEYFLDRQRGELE